MRSRCATQWYSSFTVMVIMSITTHKEMSDRADEEALVGATMVAILNPQAEVFIFHEKPRKHTLLFFPLRDGEFYYYRYGRLLAKELYWRDQGPLRFDPEVELYHQFRAEKQSQTLRLFLYFGHEIPEFDGAGYDASYADWTVYGA